MNNIFFIKVLSSEELTKSTQEAAEAEKTRILRLEEQKQLVSPYFKYMFLLDCENITQV